MLDDLRPAFFGPGEAIQYFIRGGRLQCITTVSFDRGMFGFGFLVLFGLASLY
jgi:hypothetical protein